MQRAVGAEAKAVLAECDVAGVVAVEIFPQNFFRALVDASAQGLTDADAFSRNPQGHLAASTGSSSKGSPQTLAKNLVRHARVPNCHISANPVSIETEQPR